MVNDMDYSNTVKKHGVIIALCVIGSILLMAGTSYALFYQVKTNSENQVVRTGKLAVTYGNDSRSISLSHLLPIADADALNDVDDKYASNLIIENTGSLPAIYNLKISKDLVALEAAGGSDSEFVNLDYVRLAVYIDNEEVVAPCALSSLDSSENNIYNLYSGTIDKEGTINVVVKVWLDASTPTNGDNDQTGKYIFLKLDVDSVVNEDATPEGQAATPAEPQNP